MNASEFALEHPCYPRMPGTYRFYFSCSNNRLISRVAVQMWHIVLQPWFPGLQMVLMVSGLIKHLADSPWPPLTDER